MTELGEFLEAFHGSPPEGATVHLQVSSWVHRERQAAAWQSQMQQGRAVLMYASADEDAPPQPVEERQQHESWADGQGRHRLEVRDESGELTQLTVRDGGIWWIWSRGGGAHSNEDDPEVSGGDDRVDQMILGGWGCAGALRFAPRRDEVLAGRRALVATARPRLDLDGADAWALHPYGMGFDEISFAVDPDTGAALRVQTLRDGQLIEVWSVTHLEFGGRIDEDLFRFQAPDGSAVRSLDRDLRPRRLPLHVVAREASFPVWVAAGLKESWDVDAHHFVSDEDGAESVSLMYRAHLAGYHFTVTQSSAERADIGYNPADPDWHQVTRGGNAIAVLDHGDKPSGFVAVRLERHGTHLELQSHGLDAEALIQIAVSLEEAPRQPPA